VPDRAHWNATRFDPASRAGFYESWFQRANHPSEPRAFWIRYTVFAPQGDPGRAVGELWAVAFDRTRGRIRAAKAVLPLADCSLSREGLAVRIGKATLAAQGLRGEASWGATRIAWDLAYSSPSEPLLLLPESLYAGGFPKAKALVGSPSASFSGTLELDGEAWRVDGWPGSQNHNWGSRHNDEYAWGQVSGFDDAPDAFLECGVGRVRLGPLWSPWLAPLVLRLDGREHRLNSLWRCLRNRGALGFFRLALDAREGGVRVAATFEASASDFVGLPYADPPGGVRTCLNSKLARCEVGVERPGLPPRTLYSAHRAALEIIPTRGDHGVPVLDLPTPR
jgi:hypothetical protein